MAHDEGFRRGITEEPGYDGSGLTADETKQRKAMRLLEANVGSSKSPRLLSSAPVFC